MLPSGRSTRLPHPGPPPHSGFGLRAHSALRCFGRTAPSALPIEVSVSAITTAGLAGGGGSRTTISGSPKWASPGRKRRWERHSWATFRCRLVLVGGRSSRWVGVGVGGVLAEPKSIRLVPVKAQQVVGHPLGSHSDHIRHAHPPGFANPCAVLAQQLLGGSEQRDHILHRHLIG